MDRRTYLTFLGSVGITSTAGCLSNNYVSPAAEPSPKAQTQTTSSSEIPPTTDSSPNISTPAPGECEAETVPQPSPSDGLPDSKSYPEKPTEIDPVPVEIFLAKYETAYRFNRRLAEIASAGNCLSYLDMSVTESTVTRVSNGVTGEIVTRGSFTGTTCPETTGTDTPTPLPHADLAPEAARYYVTERFLLRNGITVECWD